MWRKKLANYVLDIIQWTAEKHFFSWPVKETLYQSSSVFSHRFNQLSKMEHNFWKMCLISTTYFYLNSFGAMRGIAFVTPKVAHEMTWHSTFTSVPTYRSPVPPPLLCSWPCLCLYPCVSLARWAYFKWLRLKICHNSWRVLISILNIDVLMFTNVSPACPNGWSRSPFEFLLCELVCLTVTSFHL